MGEIATWSAVKTKVGLGKDSNECPTKAELLALSPTGTGESYIGLEISNASSYGNNETVQLNDIHKVTYKYTFTAQNTTLSFPKEGGTSTQVGIYVTSTKTKYLDGSATSEVQNVNYPEPNWPSWIIGQGPLVASENTTTESRSATVVYTQSESGKQISVSLFQAAGVETWEYTFSVQNPNLNYTALGGSATPAIAGYSSFKQRYINGKPVGTSVYVGFSSPALPSWIFMDDENHYTALENKSENSRSQVFTSTQNESGKKVTVTFTQAAGVKTHGTPTVYLGSIADIPASGGTAATPTYTYSQLWGWNGKTNDGGTISSGASVVWSENISGSNLGTTAKARTKLGSRTLTVTLNGKSGNASIDIYQAENKITNVTQGTWVVSISANPSTFTEQGGTSQISASARAPRTNHWSSGATSAASDATGTPTLSIPTAVTGFSLSGTTLTVAENKTANQRSVVVRATMDTVYKEVTVTQSAYLVEWRYTLTTSTPTLNFDALGTTKSGTISSYREKYINGSLVEGSHEGVNIQVKSTSAEIQSATAAVAITMKENTTTQARTGTVVYEQVGSGKTVTITCSQAAGTVAIREELVIKESFPTAPNIGGTVKALVRSGYWDVVNGKDTTWHDDTPTVKTKPSFVSSTSVTYELGVGYRISATMPENTSESQLSGSLNLKYGSKTLSLGVKQAGASVAWSYELKVNNGTQDLNQPVPAKPSGTYPFTISSKRYKIVNGSVTSQSEDTTWTTSIPGSPSWIHVEEQSNTLIVTVDENTTTSQRSADIVIFQTGSSDTSITLTVEQQAASITYQYTFEITDPSSKVINVPAKPIDPEPFSVSSFKTKVVNGTVTSETTRVGVTVDAPDENWLEVSVGSMGEGEVTCLENRVGSIRSATVTIRQEESGNLDQIDINQAAADIKVTYDLRWALSDRGSIPEDHVNKYSLGTGGDADRLHLFLLCDKITKIGTEEISRTPVQTGLSNLTTAGPVYTDIGGEPSAIIQDDGGQNILPALFPELKDYSNCYNIVIGSIQNLGLVQEEISMTFNKPVMDGTTQIGKVPTFLFYVDAVPYSQVMEYQFRGTGGSGAGSIYNVTVPASDGTGYFSIISFRAYIRNDVEFKREYLEPTFTAPTDVTIIKNGQNSDNSYNYALKVTDNPGEIERQWDIPFVNPVTGSQIHLYLTQESPHTPEVAFYVYNSSSLSASLLMGIGWRSNEGSDSLPNLSRGENLGAHGSNKSNIQVVYHAQPITTSQQWLPAAPSLRGFSYDGLPIALNGTDRYYNISEFQYGSSSASKLFKVTVDNIDYDPTYGGSLTLQWEARLSNNKPTNGMYVGMIVLTSVRGNLPAIYVRLYYQSPSVKPSV